MFQRLFTLGQIQKGFLTTAIGLISSKKQFELNQDIDTYDFNMNKVHPAKFKDVDIFQQGVWVVADTTMRL